VLYYNAKEVGTVELEYLEDIKDDVRSMIDGAMKFGDTVET
jgi:hypothetical protein